MVDLYSGPSSVGNPARWIMGETKGFWARMVMMTVTKTMLPPWLNTVLTALPALSHLILTAVYK